MISFKLKLFDVYNPEKDFCAPESLLQSFETAVGLSSPLRKKHLITIYQEQPSIITFFHCAIQLAFKDKTF